MLTTIALGSVGALLAVASAPQGTGTGTPPELAPKMEFPADPAVSHFTPFPTRNRIAAAGATDLDFDGTPELWFLSEQGPQAGQFGVSMARGANLGRYRGYDGTMLAPVTSWTDAASWHSTDPLLPPLTVFVSPDQPYLQSIHRTVTAGTEHPRSPQRTVWNVNQPFADTFLDLGNYEVETADHSGDGHPDICTLQLIPLDGGTSGSVVRMFRRAPTGPLQANETFFPWVCDTLRLGDFDHDGNTDFAVHVPGIGVAAFCDRGGYFVFVGGVPLAAGTLRDITVGDLHDDGQDELAIVVDQGVLVYEMLPVGYFDHIPHVVENPPGVGPLATATIVDAWWTPPVELVVVPQDGQSFAVNPFNRITNSFLPAIVRVPEDPTAYAGAGIDGQALIRADIDADGDEDLLMQTANGAWFSMLGPEHDYQPIDVAIDAAADVDAFFRLKDDITVMMAPHWSSWNEDWGTGTPDIEVALYTRPSAAADFELKHSQVFPIGTGAVQFDMFLLPLAVPAVIPAGFHARGQALLSLHLKLGNQRFASRLLWHDGDTGSQGSAVGVRWRLIATPPLPALDDDLLPW